MTDNIIDNLPNIDTQGLYSGKMGICLYLFILSRYTQDNAYKEQAEKLLDEICEYRGLYDISFEAGLSGIIWGITYLAKTKDIEFLNRNIGKMNVLYRRTDLVGGAIFLNKEAYIKAGKDNELFYGWGDEDFERIHRWKALEYCIFRADGPLYHLYHIRGENSVYKSNYYNSYTRSIVVKTHNSSKEEILKTIK